MTILCSDLLSKYLNDPVENKRFDNWLFYYLASHSQSTIQSKIAGASSQRIAIADELNQFKIPKDLLISARKESLIPDHYFNWIEDTKRFFHWFVKKYLCIDATYLVNILNLGYKDLCIATVDTNLALLGPTTDSIDKKISRLSAISGEWEKQKNIDRLFEWVRAGDIKKNIEYAYQAALSFRDNYTPNVIHTYEDFLLSLDQIRITPQEAHHASASARRKLSQKKYRDESKTKKQINALVNTKTFNNLEALSKKHGLSKARIVELLINMEVDKNVYIPQKYASWLKGEIY